MRSISPALAPSPSPSYKHPSNTIHPPTTQPLLQSPQPSSNSTTINFSPPLIAMVVTVATAFLLITYSRLISRHIIRRYRIWRHLRRRRHYLPSSNGDPLDSPPPLFDSPDGFHVYSPYGLDESVIKTIPLSLYSAKNDVVKDCAVCLLEFEEDDYVRTLPVCYHVFHVDCIDIWLRSHPNCPLCRAGIFRHHDYPFVPVMASRIRPTLDDVTDIDFTHYSGNIINNTSDRNSPNPIHTSHNDEDSNVEPLIQTTVPSSHVNITSVSSVTEITPCTEEASPRRNSSNFNSIHYLDDRSLKRSYSFGFERGVASERMLVMEAATASPWRYRRSSFWSKRPSPFSSISKARAFSFRYYRGIKSPFFRRRTSSFFPLSERFAGGSSRRSKSMASPMFLRSSVAAFSSSRLRCGDPEALLSPDRFNRR